MIAKIKKPETLFLVIGILSILFGFAINANSIYVNFHDTYFVIRSFDAATLVALILAFYALIYLILNKLKKPITLQIAYWHLGTFLLGILTFLFSSQSNSFLATNYYTISLLASIILIIISTIIFISGLLNALL
ncbi:MAG: hypothetical protein V4687_11440 [Bacteroidota bacterium]